MANFSECIEQAAKSGKFTREVAEALENNKDNPDLAMRLALDAATEGKRKAVLEAIAMSKLLADIDGHPGSTKTIYGTSRKPTDGEKFATGFLAALTKDITGYSRYNNVDILGRMWQAQFLSQLGNVIERFRTRLSVKGFSQDREGLKKIVSALYKKETGDPEIDKMGKQIADILEEIRQTFNKFGGNIAKNDFYHLPQSHHIVPIRRAGLKKWREDTKPLLDRSKILDDTGKPLTDEQLDLAMEAMYDSILSGGASKLDPQNPLPANIKKMLSSRHAEKRFLWFKEPEDWIKYNEQYGGDDIFSAITGHIDSMSKEIALLERLGPNPEAAYKAMDAKMKTMQANDRQRSMAKWVFREVAGHIDSTRSSTMADFMQGARNVIVSSTLGGAFLSSVSDTAFNALTSAFNGMNATKPLLRAMSMMTGSKEDRMFAERLGYIADAAISRSLASNRFSDVIGVGTTAKISEWVMRASLLSPWTDATRKAFGMEYSGFLADNFSKSFDQIDGHLKQKFDEYGISSKEWDAFRNSSRLEHKGAQFADMMTPEARKFQQMVMTEMEYATPVPDARVRGILKMGTDRGTIPGEVVRTAMMLKSFPITVLTTHFSRAASQQGLSDRMAYTGLLMAGTTVMGAAALQLKDIARGREPRSMGDSPEEMMKFWSAAFVQGGGAGIFGDYLFSDVNRFGQGPVASLFGPMGEMVDKTFKLTLGNAREAIKGEETNILGESVDYMGRYSPSIWQIQLLLQNSMFNQLRLMVDDGGQAKFNRIMKSRLKEYNQEHYWHPDQPVPEFLR